MDPERAQPAVAKPHRGPPLIIKCLAEFVGTFVYCITGEAATAVFLLSSATGMAGFGSLLNIAMAYGFGIAVGVIISGHASGAHLSPGVTLTFAILRGFPIWHILPYILFQFLGSIVATLSIYAVYGQALNTYERVLRATGRADQVISPTGPAFVGAILPGPTENLGRVFFGEWLASTLLGLIIFGALDRRNPLISKPTIPFLVGIGYFTAIIGFAPSTVVLNTARGLGGLIATSMIYGGGVFDNRSFVALATLTNVLGTFMGGLAYKLISSGQEDEPGPDTASRPVKES